MKLVINCGKAVLFGDKSGVLRGYEKIMLNCGKLIIQDELMAELKKSKLEIDCGSVKTVPSPRNPVRVSAPFYLSPGMPCEASFLICEGNFVVEPGAGEQLAALEGVYAEGKAFLPESMSVPMNLTADSIVKYPDHAELHLGDLELTESRVSLLKEGKEHFIARTLYAASPEAVEAGAARDMTFRAKKLVIAEAAYQKHGGMFKTGETVVIPEGYALAREGESLLALQGFGKKVFLLREITVQPKDCADLEAFDSIIVKGTANITTDCPAQLRDKIRADKTELFRGEYWKINGGYTFTHESLQSAKDAGILFTIKVNGGLTFDESVQPADLEPIAALDHNGSVIAADALQPLLRRVIGKGNGTMRSRSGFEEDLLGADKENASVVNTGHYVLI
jgi:hypothetical protein